MFTTQYSVLSDERRRRRLGSGITPTLNVSVDVVNRQARPSPSPSPSPSHPSSPIRGPWLVLPHASAYARQVPARRDLLPTPSPSHRPLPPVLAPLDPGSHTAAGQSLVLGRATPRLSSSAGLSGDSMQSACSRAECKLGHRPWPALDSWILPCHGTVGRSGLRSVVALKRQTRNLQPQS